jgi:hypothetical protein
VASLDLPCRIFQPNRSIYFATFPQSQSFLFRFFRALNRVNFSRIWVCSAEIGFYFDFVIVLMVGIVNLMRFFWFIWNSTTLYWNCANCAQSRDRNSQTVKNSKGRIFDGMSSVKWNFTIYPPLDLLIPELSHFPPKNGL